MFKTQDGCLVKEIFKEYSILPESKEKIHAKNKHGNRYGTWEYTYKSDPRKVKETSKTKGD